MEEARNEIPRELAWARLEIRAIEDANWMRHGMQYRANWYGHGLEIRAIEDISVISFLFFNVLIFGNLNNFFIFE